MNIQEYQVEFADKLATHDLSVDEFIPVFEHLANKDELKILLFSGCPCNIRVRLDWGHQGAKLERQENMCDNCMRHKENNVERVGAILDGFVTINSRFIQSERGQKMMTEAVKRNTGRDIKGSDVHVVDAEKAELFNRTPSKQTQAQMVLHALMSAHRWLEKYESHFSDNEKKSWQSLNAFIIGLLQDPYWRNDTDDLTRVIDLAQKDFESIVKQQAQEIADENGVDIKTVLDDIKQKLQDKDEHE